MPKLPDQVPLSAEMISRASMSRLSETEGVHHNVSIHVRDECDFRVPGLDQEPFLTSSGKAIEYVTTWTYNITQYNAVSIGQFPIPIKPTASPMLNQAATTVVNPNT